MSADDQAATEAAWASIERKCGREFCVKLRKDLRETSLLTTDGPRRALRMLLQVEAAATLAVYYSGRYSEHLRNRLIFVWTNNPMTARLWT